jgi:hypothetical protein
MCNACGIKLARSQNPAKFRRDRYQPASPRPAKESPVVEEASTASRRSDRLSTKVQDFAAKLESYNLVPKEESSALDAQGDTQARFRRNKPTYSLIVILVADRSTAAARGARDGADSARSCARAAGTEGR